jgi:hypothetical protein
MGPVTFVHGQVFCSVYDDSTKGWTQVLHGPKGEVRVVDHWSTDRVSLCVERGDTLYCLFPGGRGARKYALKGGAAPEDLAEFPLFRGKRALKMRAAAPQLQTFTPAD